MELGSEYNLNLSDLNIVTDNIFAYFSDYRYSFYFDSGRSAIKHIVKHFLNNMTIILPEFICESVTECFVNYNILFYRLKEDFTIDIDDLRKKIGGRSSVIFIMHYFGKVQPTSILRQVRLLADDSESLIIEDTTHSVFSRKRTIGDYLVCSIRKWLPLPGGGVLYYNQNRLGVDFPNYSKSINNNRTYGMILKDMFLKKGFDCNREYRRIFRDSEEMLDKQEDIYEISDLARFIGSCTSIEVIKEKRKHNYDRLTKKLETIGVTAAVSLEKSEVPLTCVLRVPERARFKDYLMEKNIYCAVHWPFDRIEEEQRPFAIKNAKELISLPIDQRYDDDHIDYLFKTIEEYGGELLF